MNIVSKYWLSSLLVVAFLSCSGTGAHAQSATVDSTSMPSDSSSAHADFSSMPSYLHSPVYHVNYWVSVPIIAVGAAGGLYLTAHPKSNIDSASLANLNTNNVPSFDRSSLHRNMALVPTWDKYASIGQIVGAALPLTILLDPDVRPDWLDVITIGAEANMVALGIYSISPLGPSFQTRYRPLVYYPKAAAAAAGINQADGNNKDSFFSGHVGSVAASTFFVAKVYCDYHPDANQFVAYSLASIPPLAMGYIRLMTLDHFPSDVAVGLAVGTLCGVLVPELHKIGDKNLSIGAYSSPTSGTGLTLNWNMISE